MTLAVLLMGPFMAQADATIANVAAPSIHADLGTSGAELELVVGRNGERTVIPRGRRDLVTIEPGRPPAEVEGPIAEGEELARAVVLRDGRPIATVPLVASGPVPEAGLAQRTKSWFTKPAAVVLAFAVLGGTVLLARRRRRPRGPDSRRSRDEARVA